MNVREEGRFRIEPYGAMRVPGVVFTSCPHDGLTEEALTHVAGLAALPGIVGASYAMPDPHRDDGLRIGRVAATDVDAGGVVSPDAVGFDIGCGVRLLAADLDRDALTYPMRQRLVEELKRTVPHGLSRDALWHLTGPHQLEDVLAKGARYAVERGHGTLRDLARCEDRGTMPGADPATVSARAKERGLGQLGGLGAGGHLLHVQAVDELYDEAVAKAFGLRQGQICVMIHAGSRALGHQVCADHVRTMRTALRRHGDPAPEQRLAYAPIESAEGGHYLSAMAAAANYARTNRQLLTEATRRAFAAICGTDLELIYDVSHNQARIEPHQVDGHSRRLCVQRGAATRALPPGHPDLPPDLTGTGQPVLVPGTKGSASYVLTGVPGNPAFNSTGHHVASKGSGPCRKIARLTTLGVVGT